MKILAYLAAYVPLSLFRGWVIALLWGWYVTDYFGFKPLTVVEAIGLGVLATVFNSRLPSKEDQDRSIAEEMIFLVAAPTLALVFGFAWSFVR